MINFYTYRTSNGRKVSIMLEETGLDYNLFVIDITSGEQDLATFREINPNGRIPAIVDLDGPEGLPLKLFESGAILLYLAEKTRLFLPKDLARTWCSIKWLSWQISNLGPSFGQAFHFLHQLPLGLKTEDIDYGQHLYVDQVRRLFAIMNDHLKETTFFAGENYTIADISIFPWIALHGWIGVPLSNTPNLQRWYENVRQRPAVRKGMDVPSRKQIERSGDGGQ